MAAEAKEMCCTMIRGCWSCQTWNQLYDKFVALNYNRVYRACLTMFPLVGCVTCLARLEFDVDCRLPAGSEACVAQTYF